MKNSRKIIVFDIFYVFRNEEEVGSALRKCGLPREEVYVTTKVRTGFLEWLLSVINYLERLWSTCIPWVLATWFYYVHSVCGSLVVFIKICQKFTKILPDGNKEHVVNFLELFVSKRETECSPDQSMWRTHNLICNFD